MSVSIYARDIEIYSRIIEPTFPVSIRIDKMALLPKSEQHLINVAIIEYHHEKNKLEEQFLPAIIDVLSQKIFLEIELSKINTYSMNEDEKIRKQAIETVLEEKNTMLYNLESIKINNENALYDDLRLKVSTVLNRWSRTNPHYAELLIR